MAKNPEYQKTLHSLTTKLVTCLAPFLVGSENFQSCMEYSLSNIRYHRFLDADGHRIARQIDGLHDKFVIHSKPEKAVRIKKMFHQFQNTGITDKIPPNSQVHDRLMSILLHLSDHPINHAYVKPKKRIQIEHRDAFNWGAFLLEGEDRPTCSSSSDESESENAVVDTVPRTINHIQQTSTTKQTVVRITPLEDEVVLPTVVSDYWNFNKSSYEVHTEFLSMCSLKNVKSSKADLNQLKEMHILREVIWLLSGHDNLFLFPNKGNQYTVSDNSYLNHLTQNSFNQSLLFFVEHANFLKLVRTFINSVSSQVCLTYQAFAETLRSYIKWFDTDLMAIENKVKSQEHTFLIGDMFDSLEFHFEVISQLKEVYDSSLGLDKPTEANSVKASRLLSTLYSAFVTESLIELPAQDKSRTRLHVFLKLWVESIKPYLDICDDWITSGVLNDLHNEWFLCRVNTVPDCRNASFWQNAVVPAVDNISTLLPWLKCVVDIAVIGGKSMEIIQTLNMLYKDDDTSSSINLPKHPRQKLFASFQDNLLSMLFNENEDKVTETQAVKYLTNDKPEKEMLSESLELLFSTSCFTERTVESNKFYRPFASRSPLSVLIERSIFPLLEIKCEYASSSLLRIFRSRFGLSTYLNTYHNFYLMGWGDVMHTFSTEIFKLLHQRTVLNDDPVSLNIILQESMAIRSLPSPGVFVLLNMDRNLKDGGLLGREKKMLPGVHQLIQATDCIELQCPVEWPVNIVITEESTVTYKKLFSYLMRINRALFCLEQLKFATIYLEKENSMEVKMKAHRLSLLRHKMLYLLQQWHGYIMTSVIQSEKHTFLIAMEEAKSLDNIIDAHNKFLKCVCTLCLLDEKTQAEKLVQGTLKKVLTFAITFNMLWSLGINNISTELISKHESDFNECSEFLGRILKTVAHRGSIPRLNSLAYSLL
uniref:Gamma-tubulin complex component n=1 Tax=Ciona savignyi TaxID=51511 RepID=H2Z0W0_CIOSA